MSATINVLCLHGYGQDKTVFQQAMRRYLNRAKHDGVRYLFVEAPHDHIHGGKQWLDQYLALPVRREDLTYSERGCTESMESMDLIDQFIALYNAHKYTQVLDAMARHIDRYNINVLLGFSQGANVIDTFLSHRDAPRIQCAVLMSGYSCVDVDRRVIQIPVLAVTSPNDTVTPSALQTPTEHMAVIEHNEGHLVSKGRSIVRQVIAFIKDNVN